jgi:hypothetical protein
MADDITASGKYLHILVPDFALDPVVGDRKDAPMSSFLRLGAFHEQIENEATKRSMELAAMAKVVTTSQGGHLNPDYGGEVDTSDTGVEDRGVFLDDQRKRDGSDGTLKVEDRLEHSKALLTRGGWWDHSDGNRISTTYGDKVEVIRGNYKMVVMHRQDDAELSGGVDLSGGHVQDLGPNSMPGASVRVEFRPGMFGKPGTWHLENTTNNFIQTSDYAGDFFEHWYGNLKQSTVGSENPVEFNDDLGKPYGNPKILEKTWASKIESYTGSSNWRIPEIIEKTYARETTSVTDVTGNIDESTYCDGVMTSDTGSLLRRVPIVNENTHVGTSNSKTDALATNEFTLVGASMETTIAGAQGTLTIAGASLDTEIIGAKGSISLFAISGELSIGASFGAQIGFSREIQIGDHDDTKIPNEQKKKLKELDVALERLQVALVDKRVSLEFKLSAVAVQLQGIQVAIGL